MTTAPHPPSFTAIATATAARVLVATRDGLWDSHQATALPAPTASEPLPPVDAVAGADDGSGWALAGRSELIRLRDRRTEPVASLDRPVGVCVHEHRGAVYVGGDDATLWRFDGDALAPVASFQEAPTRPAWSTPWGGPPSVFSMASYGDDLYVSVHVGGILRSSDGAETWEATIDLEDDVHQVAVDPADGTVWAATGMRGLAESRDRGGTWSYHRNGLHATYLLAVAVTDTGVLVGASSGHAGRDGKVYLFDGERFTPVEGLPDPLGGAVEPRHLAGRGSAAAVLTPSRVLFASDDGGRSWRQASPRLAAPAEVHIPASRAA
jgi:photosystem II stability/assembly factor-like uncharacterized protein